MGSVLLSYLFNINKSSILLNILLIESFFPSHESINKNLVLQQLCLSRSLMTNPIQNFKGNLLAVNYEFFFFNIPGRVYVNSSFLYQISYPYCYLMRILWCFSKDLQNYLAQHNYMVTTLSLKWDTTLAYLS